ncbi:hypothetical protein HAX54_013952 [Datura stramonium]|uniref:3-hydroxyisobutyryl-CoA hydrolase n=1 Tax=Datura stramonium TaxID=4076 RepID=A0ABS8TP95_DATST|nr:hypothetical protein [Datura stramonium]
MGISSIPSSITMSPMPPEVLKRNREVVIGEEIGRARVLTINRPNHLNFISREMALMLGQKFEKYEKDDNAEFVIIKGAGRTFSAGRDLKMFYDGRNTRDSCLEAAYRMYWLNYHIHTYKKPHIALVHGMSVGGGASLMVPMKFSVVTEKAFCSTPETSLGFHPDCGFSYMLSRLPGRLGEYLGLTGVKLKGKEVVAAGLATHLVPSEGIRATIIDKDKSPKWNPSTLDKVSDEQLDLIFKPFEDHNLELQIPIKEECRFE